MKSGERGFSLVEVLAGMGILGVMLVSIASAFQSAMVEHRMARETTVASTYAAAKLEELVALPSTSTALSPGASTETLGLGYTRRTFIADNKPSPGSKTIKVTVRRASSPRSVTFIAVRPRA